MLIGVVMDVGQSGELTPRESVESERNNNEHSLSSSSLRSESDFEVVHSTIGLIVLFVCLFLCSIPCCAVFVVFSSHTAMKAKAKLK